MSSRLVNASQGSLDPGRANDSGLTLKEWSECKMQEGEFGFGDETRSTSPEVRRIGTLQTTDLRGHSGR